MLCCSLAARWSGDDGRDGVPMLFSLDSSPRLGKIRALELFFLPVRRGVWSWCVVLHTRSRLLTSRLDTMYFPRLTRYDRPTVAHSRQILFLSLLAIASALPGPASAERPGVAAPLPDRTSVFLETHCFDCHQGEAAEAGLDLTSLGDSLVDEAVQRRWVQIFDRVHAGEMPPADYAEVGSKEREAFVAATGEWLRSYQRSEQERLGRVRGRRLSRRELERTLQDLLGIDIPLADQIPEETTGAEFSTIAERQAMSHFQLERHLTVVDAALDEAYRRAFSPSDDYQHNFDYKQVARRPERERTREPEIIGEQAVVWASNLIFYGRIPATIAPENGWYRFRVRVASLKEPKTGGVWTTVRSGLCVSSAPLLAWVTSFEATPEARDIEFDAWLPKGHMLEIRPGDSTLKKARFAGGQVGNGEGGPQDVPGIAIEQITMERFHRGPEDEEVRRLLFGELEVRSDEGQVISEQPQADATRLMQNFARRAYRHPVTDEELAGYTKLVQQALDEGDELSEALRVGYRAILCSPRFMYLSEQPGRLGDHELATRLSYMLRGSMPDAQLAELADSGRLRDPDVLRSEVERLLSGKRGRQFVSDFSAEWLDLDQIDFTEPDNKLYPDFDSVVQRSMLDETLTYLETMLRENLSVTHLIDSDFTFLNSRLARFYEIEGVTGDSLRRFDLQPEHRRGGVLTQGAILKVTANGTNTSPVLRGVWVSERLLGVPIAPPPDNVPAIEPDIRGATTIREMLEKHRSQDSCASCHVKIDPPGFALENYDPAGQWRERYIRLDGRNSERGAVIDASYLLPDGREFEDVDQFQQLVVAQPRSLARNVAEKLLTYGTGAPISFADRQAVEEILDKTAKDDYGFRSIIHAVVASPVFLSK